MRDLSTQKPLSPRKRNSDLHAAASDGAPDPHAAASDVAPEPRTAASDGAPCPRNGAPADAPGSRNAAVQTHDLAFSYDGDTFVLQDVTIRIPRGEFVAILGGNGSGKSTLAKHMNALLVPDHGNVTVLGHDTADEESTYVIRSQAGMVFQNPDDQLVASLVENDVAFGPENLGVPANELRQRVDESLKEVGLEGFQTRETAALSGGQKQRVAVAGVLAMRPDILILDEATSMLDPQGRKKLMELCHQLHREGKTIVMITHFMEEAAQAQRVIILNGGRVACDGSPEEVLTQSDLLEHLNLDVPFACMLSLELQKRGVPVHVHIHPDTLKEELCRLHSNA